MRDVSLTPEVHEQAVSLNIPDPNTLDLDMQLGFVFTDDTTLILTVTDPTVVPFAPKPYKFSLPEHISNDLQKFVTGGILRLLQQNSYELQRWWRHAKHQHPLETMFEVLYNSLITATPYPTLPKQVGDRLRVTFPLPIPNADFSSRRFFTWESAPVETVLFLTNTGEPEASPTSWDEDLAVAIGAAQRKLYFE